MREVSTEVIHKELDMIQACITRMAQNSFIIKGWFVSLVAVSIALKIDNTWVYGGLLLALGFFFYVVNFQFYIFERQYRSLYNSRIKLRVEDQDATADLYNLNIEGFKWGTIKEYAFKKKYLFTNGMLILFYFIVPLIFCVINYYVNQSSDGGKLIIEIQGLKGVIK